MMYTRVMERMTQKELAQRVGITRQHFSQIKARSRLPSRKLAVRLEKITGIKRMIWLYGTTDEIREQLEHFFSHGKRETEGAF